MSKGNPLRRVSKEFDQIVSTLSKKSAKTSAEITKMIAEKFRDSGV